MNISYCRFSIGGISWVSLGLMSTWFLIGLVRHGFTIDGILWLVTSAFSAGLLLLGLKEGRQLIDKIRLMALAINRGDLQYRITAIPEGHHPEK